MCCESSSILASATPVLLIVVTPTISDTKEPPVAVVSAISLKLPPFWPSDPDLWFAQVEASFATRGITVEKTKYEYTVAALAPDAVITVRDFILTPPPRPTPPMPP